MFKSARKNTSITKDLIKEALKRNGLTVHFLSNQLKRNRNFLNQSKRITIERLKEISQITGISVYEFIEDECFKKYYNDKGELTRIERI